MAEYIIVARVKRTVEASTADDALHAARTDLENRGWPLAAIRVHPKDTPFMELENL